VTKAPSLSRLFDASAHFEQEAAVVRLAARGLWEACPRGLGLAYTLRGHPARSVGAAVGVRDGATADDMDLDRFRRVFEHAPLYYDRYRVDRAQRGRWVELPAEWFRRSEFYSVFRPFGRMARTLACLGSRPLGCAGVLVPDDAPGFSVDEHRKLASVAAMIAGPLRLAALLPQTAPALDAIDHLMASRAEPAFLLTADARVLACSAAGQRALDGSDDLRAALGEAVHQARTQASSVLVRPLGALIHVTPCSPRGRASAYLAILSPRGDPGRDRLTARQSELIEHLREGLANAAIGDRMGLMPSTVKTMLERLYRRAGVTGRVALLRWVDRSLDSPPAPGRTTIRRTADTSNRRDPK